MGMGMGGSASRGAFDGVEDGAGVDAEYAGGMGRGIAISPHGISLAKTQKKSAIMPKNSAEFRCIPLKLKLHTSILIMMIIMIIMMAFA